MLFLTVFTIYLHARSLSILNFFSMLCAVTLFSDLVSAFFSMTTAAQNLSIYLIYIFLLTSKILISFCSLT